MHPPPVSFTEQPDKIIISAVPRRNQFIVAHIITGILERRIEAGVDPQGIASQRLYIAQLLCDAGDVTDPVTVGIVKALGVYLIEHCILQPLRAVFVPWGCTFRNRDRPAACIWGCGAAAALCTHLPVLPCCRFFFSTGHEGYFNAS